MSFAWNLKTIRNEVGLTQEELASKMGISQKTISSWETNRTIPTMGDVLSLCRVLGCTMEKLTGTKTHDIGDISFEDILVKLRSLSLRELFDIKAAVEDAILNQKRLQEAEKERARYLAQIAKYEAEINELKKKMGDIQ